MTLMGIDEAPRFCLKGYDSHAFKHQRRYRIIYLVIIKCISRQADVVKLSQEEHDGQ